jgi:hypothetical protein
MTTTNFEDRLLEQLRHVVADNPAPAPEPIAPRRRTGARLALVGAGAAAATAVAIVATGGGGTSDAYAVDARIARLSDAAGLQRALRAKGVPAVVDYRPASDATCVPAKRADVPGVPAIAVQKSGGATKSGAARAATPGTASGDGPDDTRAPEWGTTSRAKPSTSRDGQAPAPLEPAETVSLSKVSSGPDGSEFTLDPGTIPAGEQVYVTTTTGTVDSVAIAVGSAPASVPCLPVPAARP